MTPQPDIKHYPTALFPTQKNLIFAPPTFFCFFADAQLAHLVLHDTHADPSQNQKSQFYSDAPLGQTIVSKLKYGISNIYFEII